MELILETKGLTKIFGNHQAVDHLDWKVESGSIYGLLGPNGSGKSTTLSMLLGILKPTNGSFEWFGTQDRASSIQRIGAIIESPKFYPYLSGTQNLNIVADIKKVDYKEIPKRLDEVGLSHAAHQPYERYSLGMKQRLAIASAMLKDPEVLILDEPTNGLDPEGIIAVRNIIQSIAAQGKTILLASHLLHEVEKVCSHVILLNKGKSIYNGSIASLSGAKKIRLQSEHPNALFQALQHHPEISDIVSKDGFYEISVPQNLKAEQINQYLFEQHVILNHLSSSQAKLEDSFLNLIKNDQ